MCMSVMAYLWARASTHVEGTLSALVRLTVELLGHEGDEIAMRLTHEDTIDVKGYHIVGLLL
jgi:hypothetical protein